MRPTLRNIGQRHAIFSCPINYLRANAIQPTGREFESLRARQNFLVMLLRQFPSVRYFFCKGLARGILRRYVVFVVVELACLKSAVASSRVFLSLAHFARKSWNVKRCAMAGGSPFFS